MDRCGINEGYYASERFAVESLPAVQSYRAGRMTPGSTLALDTIPAGFDLAQQVAHLKQRRRIVMAIRLG